MKEKKINLIFHSVVVMLLTLIFAISTAFGWYTQNKVVSATGIGGTTNKGNLTSNSSIYTAKMDENGNVIPPDLSNPNTNATGLLSGDVVYYGVTLHSTNDEMKDISLFLQGVDGGEWFSSIGQDEISKSEYEAFVSANSSIGEYTYSIPEKDAEGNYVYEDANKTVIKYMDVVAKTYNDSEIGLEFYFTELDGLFYKNYLYLYNNGTEIYKCNMIDVYTIRLQNVYITPDGGTQTLVSLSDLVNDGHLSSKDILEKRLSQTAHDKKIDRIPLLQFFNWDPMTNHDITFIFEIRFNITNQMLDDAESGKLSMNSMARKNLSFDGMLIIGEDK